MTTRTPLEQRMYDEGKADASAGKPATPPTMGGKAADAYQAGYADGTPPTPAKKAPATKKTPAKKAPAKTSSKPRARRARTSAPGRSARAAQRRVVRPVEQQLTSALTALAFAVGLALFLNALRNVQTASAALNAITKAIDWLDAPRPIPYRK